MMIGWGKIHKKNKPKGREGKHSNNHLLPKHIEDVVFNFFIWKKKIMCF